MNLQFRAALSVLLAVHSCSVAHAAELDSSFLHGVMPVLSKAGCNQGACHGNARGKGGFRLSLRGQDAAFDHSWLTREARGRRVNTQDPGASLLLLKATAQLAHQGGKRFSIDSLEYSLLRDWIAAGAPLSVNSDQLVERLEVSPQDRYLAYPADSVQLRVTATLRDGSRRDVTRLATYEVSNLKAELAATGHVQRLADGEVTIVARYLNQQAAVHLAFVPQREAFTWDPPPAINYVDRLVYDKLKKLRINPSAQCDDHTFIRRAFLDALGVLPTSQESRQFVQDARDDKRARLIDSLLSRPEFADHWALKWSDILRTEEKVLDNKGVEVFHAWIRDSIAQGQPVDRFVRALLRAEGSTYDNPPANYWRANRDPATRGETTARLFLGVRLQCAKCHNHPFDRWTQDDYYTWAAVFARVDYEVLENKRQDRLDKNEFTGEQRVLIADKGSVRNPTTGRLAEAKLLGARRLGPGAYRDRLTPLAVWLTSPENTRFAESSVNFVWYHLLGRGIVEPIDDFRATNPPSNPRLLAALADDFVQHQFDLRHLVRTIMNSTTYQLSAEPNSTNESDERNFSRAIVFRLQAEKLIDAQSAVIGAPAAFQGYPLGLRAGQIPGVRKTRRRDAKPSAGDRFLKAFGKPERLLACECERSNETTLAQTFLLIGGLQDRLAESQNRLAELADPQVSNPQVVDELYWSALSRPPTPDELQVALHVLEVEPDLAVTPGQRDWAQRLESLLARPGLLQLPDDRFVRIQDLAWAILNSKEFILRH